MPMMSRRRALQVAGAAAALPLIRQARADEPLKIRVAWNAMPGHLIPVLYTANPAALRHYGKSYVVEATKFNGSPAQLPALAAGEIDIGTLAPLNFALAVNNAHLDDIRVVGDLLQDRPGWHNEQYIVRNDLGVAKISDLKGKKLAINAKGSAMDTGLRAMLHKNGVDPDRDVTTLEVGFPNMPAMMEEKKIDFAAMQQPFSTQLLATGRYHVLFTSLDAMGGPNQGPFIAAREKFLEAHKAVVMDYFEDHVRAIRWFLSEEGRPKAQQIVADYMKVPVEQLRYLFTPQDYYRDPWAVPDVHGIQVSIDVSVAESALPKGLTVAPKYVDLTYIEEAKKRIGA